MVKVYAVALAVGFVGLLWVILGEGLGASPNSSADGSTRSLGRSWHRAIGGVVGFGMGGMSAEFSPLDLSWQVALALALVAGALAGLWAGSSLAGGDAR